jgi:hypothetical protein
MSKYKSTRSPTNDEFTFVLNSGIKVYPISILNNDTGNFDSYIQVDDNGKIITYDKVVKREELSDKIAQTIIYFYNKLKTTK